MFKISNYLENDDVIIKEELNNYKVVEYARDLSCKPAEAIQKYYMAEMGVTKKQLYVELNDEGICLQPGFMQWMVGDIQQTTGLKGVGDMVNKMFAAKASGESVVKPEYRGTGAIITEPTYRHILLEDLNDWDNFMVIQDGLFHASDLTVKHKIVARQNLSSATLGKEGLFNLSLQGEGVVALECAVPREELIIIKLEDDQIKIDGSYAIAWSGTLNFTVERSGKTLLGSAASGEGLVNVYRGTGKILMMPQV